MHYVIYRLPERTWVLCTHQVNGQHATPHTAPTLPAAPRLEVFAFHVTSTNSCRPATSALKCIGKFPTVQATQVRRQISRRGIDGKCPAVVQEATDQGSRFFCRNLSQHHGAREDGDGARRTIFGKKPRGGMRVIEVVDQDSRIQEAFHSSSSHSSRKRCCQANPSP